MVSVVLSSEDTTWFGPVPVGPGEDQKAANRAANAAFAQTLQPAEDRMNEILRSLGATEPLSPLIDGFFTVPDIPAALTVRGLESERSDAPDSLHWSGTWPRGIRLGGLQPGGRISTARDP